MNVLDPEITFAKDKPFYALVIGYLAQVHGFLELTSRGLRYYLDKRISATPGLPIAEEDRKRQFVMRLPAANRDAAERVLRGRITELFGKPQLASVAVKGIDIKTEILASEMFDNHKLAIQYFNRLSAGSLLILAWEVTESYHSTHELWEFLRHCRNAAAHKGHFNLHAGEPKRTAKWRSLHVEKGMHGRPLFPDPPSGGFIGPGDVLYLLADIEQTFPEIG
jgi:hypothetical protein